jgi:hypothetical protein
MKRALLIGAQIDALIIAAHRATDDFMASEDPKLLETAVEAFGLRLKGEICPLRGRERRCLRSIGVSKRQWAPSAVVR